MLYFVLTSMTCFLWITAARTPWNQRWCWGFMACCSAPKSWTRPTRASWKLQRCVGALQLHLTLPSPNKFPPLPPSPQAVLDAATQTVAKLKSHAGKVEELKRRHAKLSRRLLGVMQLVDCALAPTTVPSCAPGQARLTQQLEGLLTQLAQPGKGLVARAQQLILLQQELAGHTGAGRAGAMSASDEARLARHLPEITAHLERQQVTIRGLADLIKADQIDLEIMKRELRRKRGRRANHSAVDSVVSGLD